MFSQNTYKSVATKSKKPFIIGGIVLVMLFVVLIVSLTSSPKSSQTLINDGAFLKYDDGDLSLIYPKELSPTVSSGGTRTITFASTDATTKGSIRVSRYAPAGDNSTINILEDQVTKDGTGSSIANVQTTRMTVNGSQVLQVTNTGAEKTYYVFGQNYVWTVSLAVANNQTLDKYSDTILRSLVIDKAVL